MNGEVTRTDVIKSISQDLRKMGLTEVQKLMLYIEMKTVFYFSCIAWNRHISDIQCLNPLQNYLLR